MQVTSQIPDAQQFTIKFANDNLLGAGNFQPDYRTSKARVCVTVGMMTTGYDCPDLLNLGMFRPIFSPTDFIQIKGRGTRRHSFLDQQRDSRREDGVAQPQKTEFKLFDFFGNCEYFETEFNYDQVLERPQISKGAEDDPRPVVLLGSYEHRGSDILSTIREETIGPKGMKIDRMLFEKFANAVREDETVVEAVKAGQWDRVIDHVNRELMVKPEEYYTLAKLRNAAAVDRRLTLREILEKVFEIIPRFKSQRRTAGRGVRQVRRRLHARKRRGGRGHSVHQSLLQGLRDQRRDSPDHCKPKAHPTRHHRGPLFE